MNPWWLALSVFWTGTAALELVQYSKRPMRSRELSYLFYIIIAALNFALGVHYA